MNFSYIKWLKGIFTHFRWKQVVKNYIDYVWVWFKNIFLVFIFIFKNNFYFLYCLFLKIRLIKKKKTLFSIIFLYEINKKKLNFIYSFIVSLYNGITQTVQKKCTGVYKTTLYERFQPILNNSFIFLIIHELHTYVIHFI